MKYITILLLLIGFDFSISAQQTINRSIVHEGIQRDYILYIPAIYDASEDVPLVLNFHGYGTNANQQMFYGDFRDIADTEGFLLVHPQGSILNGDQQWNVGFLRNGNTTDDVGFTAALIDELANLYTINLDRVYATGMSNGGFMSFLLACQLSEKIAAVASVTGSMTPDTYDACNAQQPTPILQIHGTGDSNVLYNGDTWTRSIEDVIFYWVNYNNCETSPTTAALTDINRSDGSTVEHIIYSGGDNGVTTEHMKIIGGGHTWPGSTITFPGTNQDINASMEIWQFFSRYDINGIIECSTASINKNNIENFKVYPNPVKNAIHISVGSEFIGNRYAITSISGQKVSEGKIAKEESVVNIQDLGPGIYFIQFLSTYTGAVSRQRIVKHQ